MSAPKIPLPDNEVVAVVELIDGWSLAEADVGIWRGADDGRARVTLQCNDLPMLPHNARLLATRC